jgi:predicted phage-related endonuclease
MLNRIKKSNIENELATYKKLSEQIKILEAQKDNLKNSLIVSYFAKHSEYLDKNGIVKATYKSQIRSIFDTVTFRKKHEDLYQAYCNDKEFYQFLVK